MTISFVRFIRMLMAEVTAAFERGVNAEAAGARGEVLVDVAVEPEENELMQRTLTSLPKRMPEQCTQWVHRVHRLQVELGQQSPGTRNANIEGLRTRLDRDNVIPLDRREAVVAVLVAMTEPDTNAATGDLSWQLRMWDLLFTRDCEEGRPGSSTDALCRNGGVEISNEDLEMMAADEREVRRHRVEMERQQQEHDEEDARELQYRVGLRSQETRQRLTAAEYKQWEDWEWFNIMNQGPPPRR